MLYGVTLLLAAILGLIPGITTNYGDRAALPAGRSCLELVEDGLEALACDADLKRPGGLAGPGRLTAKGDGESIPVPRPP
jgi:hypothetical protein